MVLITIHHHPSSSEIVILISGSYGPPSASIVLGVQAAIVGSGTSMTTALGQRTLSKLGPPIQSPHILGPALGLLTLPVKAWHPLPAACASPPGGQQGLTLNPKP